MLRVEINKQTNKAVIQADGGVAELTNDLAILIGSIYHQMQGADPTAAYAFRQIIIGMVNDVRGPVWGETGDQIGYAIKKD